MMRYAMPVVDGRGAGLGNELIVWAKAFIAGQALQLKTLHPAWGLNQRGYWRYFGTSRTDYAVHRLMRATLPKMRFDESDYHRHGGESFAEALVRFSNEHDLGARTPFVLEIAGMWGGFPMLDPAREFIRGALLNTRWTAENLYTIANWTGDERLRVGVHIRHGDFGAPVERGTYSGKFNVALPMSWYEETMATLHRAFGNDVVFVIASDASPEALVPLTSRFPCVATTDLPNSDVSDLLALSASDFLICSVSSFSMWAAFLGEMPYAWFEPQLTLDKSRLLLWKQMKRQRNDQSSQKKIITATGSGHNGDDIVTRGTAVEEDGALPDSVINALWQRLAHRRRATDLIRYGAVPAKRGVTSQ